MKFNNVTEKGNVSAKVLFLVTAKWRGGHDQRPIFLNNLYTDEKQAISEWEDLNERGPKTYKQFTIGPLVRYEVQK